MSAGQYVQWYCDSCGAEERALIMMSDGIRMCAPCIVDYVTYLEGDLAIAQEDSEFKEAMRKRAQTGEPIP